MCIERIITGKHALKLFSANFNVPCISPKIKIMQLELLNFYFCPKMAVSIVTTVYNNK